jgi:hypothetical protein
MLIGAAVSALHITHPMPVSTGMLSRFLCSPLLATTPCVLQVDNFLDKNKDFVVEEHRKLLGAATCGLVAQLFAPPPEQDEVRGSIRAPWVATGGAHGCLVAIRHLTMSPAAGCWSARRSCACVGLLQTKTANACATSPWKRQSMAMSAYIVSNKPTLGS